MRTMKLMVLSFWNYHQKSWSIITAIVLTLMVGVFEFSFILVLLFYTKKKTVLVYSLCILLQAALNLTEEATNR